MTQVKAIPIQQTPEAKRKVAMTISPLLIFTIPEGNRSDLTGFYQFNLKLCSWDILYLWRQIVAGMAEMKQYEPDPMMRDG